MTCHLFYVASQLGSFDGLVKQMLEDVQERLVYRTHIYIQTDITGYNPAPGDLAYPDKLEMMEVSLLSFEGMLFCRIFRHKTSINFNQFSLYSTGLTQHGFNYGCDF